MDSISMCSITFICLIWMQEAVWVGCLPQPWCNDIILTSQVTQNPKIWPKEGGYNCLMLLSFAHGQQMHVLKHIVYALMWMQEAVWGGCNFQPWRNDIISTPHKWSRTSNFEPSRVDNCVRCYHMPMDSISMCSNTLYHMFNIDAGSSLGWLSASTMT